MMEAVPNEGAKRSLPDGGAQVYLDGRWQDGARPEVRARALALVAPPSNIEAEQAVLGCLLFDNSAMERCDGLAPEHFHEGFHGRLFEAFRDTYRAGHGSHIDAILLVKRFEGDPAFVELGGLSYLGLLVDRAPPAATAGDYAREVMDMAQRRELIDAGRELANQARLQMATPAAEIIAAAEGWLAEIGGTGPSRALWQDGGSIVAKALAEARQRQGVQEFTTGLDALDEFTNGLTRGEMVVYGGRPGMGKSIVGLHIAKANAKRGLGSCFFSLEMAEAPLGLRLACDEAYHPDARYDGLGLTPPTMDGATKHRLSPTQWAALEEAERALADLPLLFDTRPGLTVAQIEACARRAHREWAAKGIKAGPVVIDHLTIVRPDKERSGNKVAEVGDVSRGLAEMAKRLNVPVVALCQLSRQNENRDDKRPNLADLRWSGEIEQDARQVVFLYRPEYYLRPPQDGEDFAARAERESKLEAARNKLFLIVAKNNSGALGQAEVFCDVASSAVRDRVR